MEGLVVLKYGLPYLTRPPCESAVAQYVLDPLGMAKFTSSLFPPISSPSFPYAPKVCLLNNLLNNLSSFFFLLLFFQKWSPLQPPTRPGVVGFRRLPVVPTRPGAASSLSYWIPLLSPLLHPAPVPDGFAGLLCCFSYSSESFSSLSSSYPEVLEKGCN